MMRNPVVIAISYSLWPLIGVNRNLMKRRGYKSHPHTVLPL